MNALPLALVALAVALVPGEAQTSASPSSNDSKPDITVRLEPHDGQTHFRIGDRMLVDLVFTGPTAAYSVEIDDNPYLSIRDVITVAPDAGWFRSHTALIGQGENGNALARLDGNPVRVPILLNRAITFMKPGHYEVTVRTERVFPSGYAATFQPAECDRCRDTNPLGIDVAEFDESEEAPLVAALSRNLEETTEHGIPEVLTAEEKEEIKRQMETARSQASSPEEQKKNTEPIMREISEIVQKQETLMQDRERTRREAAERLAYLPGDDAMRAKVRFIAAAIDNGDPDPMGFILVNGLPGSRNLDLQLTLLQQAWRDPQHVPTSILQSALRQARELVRRGSVTEDSMVYAGTAEERKTAYEAFQGDLKEVVATLPLRSGEIRDRTIDFLKRAGIADPLNQPQTATR